MEREKRGQEGRLYSFCEGDRVTQVQRAAAKISPPLAYLGILRPSAKNDDTVQWFAFTSAKVLSPVGTAHTQVFMVECSNREIKSPANGRRPANAIPITFKHAEMNSEIPK